MLTISMVWLSWLLAQDPASASPSADCNLELRIGPDKLHLMDGAVAFTASLSNRGRKSLLLVLPGDGSTSGKRTPIVEWHLTPKPTQPLLGCANINALQPGEVFELAPGETRELGAWASPTAYGGPFRARMVYVNEPMHQWGGLPLGAHDKAEMERVHRTDRCRVESNEIEVFGYRRIVR